MAETRTFIVSEDDDGIRLDRWFKRHLPEVSFNLVSRWARTGQLRIDGKRATPGDRIEAGQEIRVPPAEASPEITTKAKRERPERPPLPDEDIEYVQKLVIHRDKQAIVINKP